MLKQLSAGIVVYRVGENNDRTYLLLQYPGKYWDLPKGKLEENERWIDAALRETKEETGLDLSIHEDFEHSYTYVFNDFKGNKIEKTVVFFVGKACPDSQVTLSYEHIDYLWLSFDQARIQIHFENVKQLIDEVDAFLNKKYNVASTCKIKNGNIYA
jgi:8-oxo-dGTP pyrophosphatase MutT (NUDIX family)